MREILFRGKRVDNKEWAFGDLLHLPNGDVVILSNKGYVKIIPETVGQYTGLTDPNGKKIFEGDIVKSCCCLDDGKTMAVKFDTLRRGWFPFACGDGCGCCEVDTYSPEYIEVIGNIYDNPELLGEMK